MMVVYVVEDVYVGVQQNCYSVRGVKTEWHLGLAMAALCIICCFVPILFSSL